MADLLGRTVLITGASSGLGAHFARICAAQGANVVLAARRVDRLRTLVAEIGDKALAVELDVTDERSVVAAYDRAEARFAAVDTIIANAGVSAPGRSIALPGDALTGLIATNLTGVYLTVREGARRLIDRGPAGSKDGRVVIIGSITAHLTGHGESAYAATKAAVAHLGRNFAREWAHKAINVNVIQPRYIATDISREWFASEGGKAQIARFPRRRLQPIETLDAMMLYLCSDAAAGMTGSVIDLDDGQSL
ncbi:SDR family NAD(P)-dependent oxidoreductase [Sphingopyxis sp. MG]|uniref:SDR family NAD(P)-dependent oxidoreductase n=1 Tax=Sphingopyxis sp. MG TaxID=1866325 RepID=UPI000CDF5053|nr:SDR family NAD(P)-dependent oxidoreductase [Sphingopyxis sp. MG]AVA14646.1 short-chain dehydrogenase [Sphingopyxis sp. MG]